METEQITYFSLPLDTFKDRSALAEFLNNRELTQGEIVKEFGYYADPTSKTASANYFGYVPLDILADPFAERLHIDELDKSWDEFVLDHFNNFELLDRAEFIFSGGNKKEVVLMRKLAAPIVEVAGGGLASSSPGWNWLVPQIVPGDKGEDLIVNGATCTWFGGPHDHQDNGETSSGKVNTRQQTDFHGCALPMNGFRKSRNTMGSPIPRFRWLTPIEVECVSPDMAGRKITVELIDLGPARDTHHAIDLTEPAFNALGAASSRGVITVNFRIRNWRQQLEPGATLTEIPVSSSEQKPTDATGNKIRAVPQFAATFDVAAFRAFIASLQLRNITTDELLPYFVNVRNGVSNDPPPGPLWQNFAPTLLIIDAVRSALSAPLHATSTYRAPAYNRQLEGAAAFSQHMAFRAADIQVVGKTPTEVHQALRALRGTRLSIPAGAQFASAGMVNSGNGIDPSTPFNLVGF